MPTWSFLHDRSLNLASDVRLWSNGHDGWSCDSHTVGDPKTDITTSRRRIFVSDVRVRPACVHSVRIFVGSPTTAFANVNISRHRWLREAAVAWLNVKANNGPEDQPVVARVAHKLGLGPIPYLFPQRMNRYYVFRFCDLIEECWK